VSQLASPVHSQLGGLTWQKLILGDWSRVVRDPLDVCRLLFLTATIVWAATGHPVTPLIGACVVLGLARAANLPRFYDAGLIVAMVLLGWGEVLGVYDSWRYYDNVVHTTVPLLLTGLLCVLLMRLDVLPELQDLTQLHQRIGFFLTALFFGMAIGAGWEIVEWTLDSTTGSNLVISTTDTATDLIWDTIGAAASALILVLWSLGNHSLKRRPGSQLAHKPFASFLTVQRLADHDG
jgi:uncharacterized membrane protein YjdF